MKEFRDRVAVVTGAASGIGRGLAERLASEGMKVVLADVEEAALAQTEREMKDGGATVLAVRTDVSNAEEVQALAERTLAEFGAVHVVCNNAGVGAGAGPLWENTPADWHWVMGVNLWGVIHGVRTFVPIMLRQETEGHIVNTASIAGLISGPLGIYGVTKFGVVALSETLYIQLQAAGGKIGVSVLCPGFVNTNITDATRNRPPELRNEGGDPELTPEQETVRRVVEQMLKAGMSPSAVADRVLDAIRENRFYILTHPEMKGAIRSRMENILDEKNPTFSGLA